MKQRIPPLICVVANVAQVCRGQSSATTTTLSSTASSTAAASSGSTSYAAELASYLDGLPSCATPCVTTSLSNAQCRDTSCLCSDDAIFNDAAACVKSSCGYGQQLVTKNATETACHRRRRDRSGKYNATSIAMCAVTGTLVVMRTGFKLFFSGQRTLKPDDLVILLVSALVGLPCTILNVKGLSYYGLGRDVWTLQPAAIVEFARYFFIQQILYVFLMTSIKLSLLLFYLSIFPGKITRLLLWITFAVNALSGVSFILVSVFQCAPIQFYWMQYAQQGTGKCLNINLLGWLNGVSSVAIDLWMIGIPLFQVKKLELHWKKKLGVAVMFLTGALSLVHFYNSENRTWDLWQTAWWSTIEINIGLICACLPAVRLMLVRMWPQVFGGTISSTMARSRASRGNSMLVRRQKIRIASMEMALEDASSSSKETAEQWESCPAAPDKPWDGSFCHAK
ncbi:Extracellular membrane protein, CFEM domain protein [Metarhizium album ARSEF 1941]|uniref:Extracellular membrane protein, CFEM domain protein n=1 Tax=Metarhizium album (strain ARSEF 1941) TaxID=1081103 RepID=A0A0B2WJM4_METAS|nr:Extracellular membrane protein, CFEM domain protein [Metarhizium album ARSEF 1941]KHN93894.1 Extracellular membrane protein, CFEM domain protein [Metarhizium album ARSEF 1941]